MSFLQPEMKSTENLGYTSKTVKVPFMGLFLLLWKSAKINILWLKREKWYYILWFMSLWHLDKSIFPGGFLSLNVYLKLSVAAWWSTVAYKTHAKYPCCEPVLLQSKVVTWYLHFSEELEVEVESIEKPKIYFSGKVYCRREMDMITAFFWGIRGSEG